MMTRKRSRVAITDSHIGQLGGDGHEEQAGPAAPDFDLIAAATASVEAAMAAIAPDLAALTVPLQNQIARIYNRSAIDVPYAHLDPIQVPGAVLPDNLFPKSWSELTEHTDAETDNIVTQLLSFYGCVDANNVTYVFPDPVPFPAGPAGTARVEAKLEVLREFVLYA